MHRNQGKGHGSYGRQATKIKSGVNETVIADINNYLTKGSIAGNNNIITIIQRNTSACLPLSQASLIQPGCEIKLSGFCGLSASGIPDIRRYADGDIDSCVAPGDGA